MTNTADLYFPADTDPAKLEQISAYARSLGVSATSYETLIERRWAEEAGFCECGRSKQTRAYLASVLAAFRDRVESRGAINRVDEAILADHDSLVYLVHYVLDAMGLTEHGGGVSGAWLSYEGERLLDELNAEMAALEGKA